MVLEWPTVGRAVHRTGRLYTRYYLQELGYARHVAAILSLLQYFVHISLLRQVKRPVWTYGWCEGNLCRSVPLSSILQWAGGSREAGRYTIMLSRDKDHVQMSGSLASAAKREA